MLGHYRYSADIMNMSMVLPEDSLFRTDLRKVLDLLYRKFKTEVEDNDPMDIALREFVVKNGSATASDLGANVWITRSELEQYDISYASCSEILKFLDKSKCVEQTFDTRDKPFAGTSDPALFSVIINFDFENTYILLLAKIGSIANRALEKNEDRLIKKDTMGNYSYNGRPLKMGLGSIYYKIFDALYLYGNQDGFLSYDAIEQQLMKKGVEEARSEELRNKRINNAIAQLFKTTKVGTGKLMNTVPNGGELITIERGHGLRLNNPLI